MTRSTVQPGKAFFELDDATETYVEWYVEDVVFKDDGVAALLTSGEERATIDADRLEAAVRDKSNPWWVPAMYEPTDGPGSDWIPHPRLAEADAADAEPDVDLRTAPDSPSELTFEKIEGRGSRTEVNQFLEGAGDGLVFHELGGVSSWKAAFVARYEGAIVSTIVLHHYHPSTNGTELAITRLANHTNAPKNTSTWIIARARKWAERAGYDRLATYAGVGGNEGVCYQAAGFEPVGDPVPVEGTNWSDDHHGAGEGNSSWLKQKYVYDLSPEQYVHKPDEWAVLSVADGIVNGAAVATAGGEQQ